LKSTVTHSILDSYALDQNH